MAGSSVAATDGAAAPDPHWPSHSIDIIDLKTMEDGEVASAVLALVAIVVAIYARKTAAEAEERTQSAVPTVDDVTALSENSWNIAVSNAGYAVARHTVIRLIDNDGRLVGSTGDQNVTREIPVTFFARLGDTDPAHPVQTDNATFPLRVRFEWLHWERDETKHRESGKRIESPAELVAQSEPAGLVADDLGAAHRAGLPPDIEQAGTSASAARAPHDADELRIKAQLAPVHRITPELIWGMLGDVEPDFGRICNSDLTWADVLIADEGRGLLGEVTEPTQWSKVPRGKGLRVLGVENDGIRWATEDMSVLTGPNHEHLCCKGDYGRRRFRKGWITVSHECIEVQASHVISSRG